ncbi:MAG: hypothetical protein AB1847_11220 [bacterium]
MQWVDKGTEWLLALFGMITGALILDNVKTRRTMSEKYVLKEDLHEILRENREDHQRINDKLDAIKDALSKKEDRKTKR